MTTQDPIITIKEKALQKKRTGNWIYIAVSLFIVLIIGGVFYQRFDKNVFTIKVKWRGKQVVYVLKNNVNQTLPFFIPENSQHEVELEIENNSWQSSQLFVKNPIIFDIKKKKIQVQLTTLYQKPGSYKQLAELALKVKKNTASQHEVVLFASIFSKLYNKEKQKSPLVRETNLSINISSLP
ncbi:hypothetical protein [Candidatus Uabimicrobium sp. HlEnr_7]|uniref:hypothetical protein n=1 Tax=Candidatus Uabimicrobium helgolandensis TaxID=3095367 RepID=UPI003556CAAB